MKYFKVILICTLIGTPFFGEAQNGATRKADNLYEKLFFAPAAREYEKALAGDPSNVEAAKKLANCYFHTNRPEQAEYWLTRVYESGSASSSDILFYSKILMTNQNYDKAKEVLQETSISDSSSVLRDRYLYSCENKSEFLKDSATFEISNLDINTNVADFGPNISRNKLVFSSAKGQQIAEMEFKWMETPFLELYEAEYYGKTDLGTPELLFGDVNTKFHEAISSTTPDGKKIYFTRNNFSNGKIKTNTVGAINLKTFSMEKIRDKWVKEKELKFNSNEYSVGHPCLSPDGNLLYFVSDKPGGQGQTDIYVAKKNGNDWGEPKNLGNTINSPGREMFPWMNGDGVLFFASDGHKGLGGLDIYEVIVNKEGSVEVRNVGAPINSSYDDFSIVYNSTGRFGFFSSNRPGGKGDDDIYGFEKRIKIKARVRDLNTGNPLPEVITDVICDEFHVATFTDEDGMAQSAMTPECSCIVVFEKEGYEGKTARVSTVGHNLGDPIFINVHMVRKGDKSLVGGMAIPVGRIMGEGIRAMAGTPGLGGNGEREGAQGVGGDGEMKPEFPISGFLPKYNSVPKEMVPDGSNFTTIYYNFDKSDIRFDASEQLDQIVEFMNKFGGTIVHMVAHSDSRGGRTYNQKLSRKRAKSAFKYLVEKGIPENRLSYEWKGEKESVNGCLDGVDCSEFEYQLNRRTQFSVFRLVE